MTDADLLIHMKAIQRELEARISRHNEPPPLPRKYPHYWRCTGMNPSMAYVRQDSTTKFVGVSRTGTTHLDPTMCAGCLRVSEEVAKSYLNKGV